MTNTTKGTWKHKQTYLKLICGSRVIHWLETLLTFMYPRKRVWSEARRVPLQHSASRLWLLLHPPSHKAQWLQHENSKGLFSLCITTWPTQQSILQHFHFTECRNTVAWWFFNYFQLVELRHGFGRAIFFSSQTEGCQISLCNGIAMTWFCQLFNAKCSTWLKKKKNRN